MTETLDVDGFEIDIERLYDSLWADDIIIRRGASILVIRNLITNLTQDSKKRFEEYQEQNDPCK